MVHCVDEHRESECVGEEDELLPRGTAFLTGGGEEFDRRHPFVGCESRFAREVVKVCDELCHQVLESLVGTLGVDKERVRGDVLGGEVEHWGNFYGRGVHLQRLSGVVV